jgi:hypothetical protein
MLLRTTTSPAGDYGDWGSTWPRARTWLLHVAATPAEATSILDELGITVPVHNLGNDQFPAYLSANGGAYGPPSWLGCLRAELNRRGYRTSYCSDNCPLHTWPVRRPARAETGATAAS